MTEQEKSIDYYRTSASQHTSPFPKPRYVPKRVSVKKTIRSDLSGLIPGPHPKVEPGIYEVECNQYGAVSVVTDLGPLGLKLDEFDIVEMTENPKW